MNEDIQFHRCMHSWYILELIFVPNMFKKYYTEFYFPVTMSC